MIFPKFPAKKEKKLPFLLRLWRQQLTHRNNKIEVGACETDNQEESLSAFDVDVADRLEAGISNPKAVGEDLPCGVLKHLFKQPEWSALDGLNEYDEDYTSFTPRGEILTQDMIREYLRVRDQISGGAEQNAPRFSADEAVLGDLERESEDDLGISSDPVSVRSDSGKSPHDQS